MGRGIALAAGAGIGCAQLKVQIEVPAAKHQCDVALPNVAV